MVLYLRGQEEKRTHKLSLISDSPGRAARATVPEPCPVAERQVRRETSERNRADSPVRPHSPERVLAHSGVRDTQCTLCPGPPGSESGYQLPDVIEAKN